MLSRIGLVTRWGLFFAGLGIIISNLVFAAGKAPPASCGDPNLSTPIPIRAVIIGNGGSVGTKPFKLPNGAQVNLNADLNTILNTTITESGAFVVSDQFTPGACDRYL